MKRRAFLAAASAAVFGAPVLGETQELPAPDAVPLPSRLGMTDVASIEGMTGRFRELARQYGGHAEVVSAAARNATRLAGVPASDHVQQRLASALADLDILAGWCCHDEHHNDHARWHYRQAIDLGDRDQAADAMQYIGIVESANGAPNDALKFYQLSEARLGTHGDPALIAWGHAVSAYALATLGRADMARDRLARARDGWQPAVAGDQADMNYQTALVATRLGQSESAERFAGAVNGGGVHRPVGVLAGILRARLHVEAGEPRGLALARNAIDDVSGLRSLRARDRLAPLAVALESRPDGDARQLARRARRVASTTV